MEYLKLILFSIQKRVINKRWFVQTLPNYRLYSVNLCLFWCSLNSKKILMISVKFLSFLVYKLNGLLSFYHLEKRVWEKREGWREGEGRQRDRTHICTFKLKVARLGPPDRKRHFNHFKCTVGYLVFRTFIHSYQF